MLHVLVYVVKIEHPPNRSITKKGHQHLNLQEQRLASPLKLCFWEHNIHVQYRCLMEEAESTHISKLFNQRREQSTGDELLDLLAWSCSDVGQRPRCLLLHACLWVPHQLRQDVQDASINCCLGLQVGATHYVSNGAKSRGLEFRKKRSEVIWIAAPMPPAPHLKTLP